MIKHFISQKGYIGDVMPFYENGELHIFYLRAPFEPERKSVENLGVGHAVTKDMLHWEELPDALHRDQPYDMFGCHTGSIVKKDGRYYFFYSGIPDNPWRENSSTVGLCVAYSDDLINWQKDPANPIITPQLDRFPKVEYRDPTVTYWPEKDIYLMSVSTVLLDSEKKSAGGAVVLHTSPDLVHWTQAKVIWHPGKRWVPECTNLLEIHGRWYLTYQAWLQTAYKNAQTFYLVSDSPYGPWEEESGGSLDGGHLWAGKPVKVEQRILLLGNIPTRENAGDNGNWQWGGHLAYVRELSQQTDGLLRILPVKELSDKYSEDKNLFKVCPLTDNWIQRGKYWIADTMGYELATVGRLCPEGVSFEVEIGGEQNVEAGIVLRTSQLSAKHNGPPSCGYEVCLDFNLGRLVVRPISEAANELAGTALRKQDLHTVRVILENDILEVFVDGCFALTTRLCSNQENSGIGFFVKNGSAEFSVTD